MSHWLKSLKEIFGTKQTREPVRNSPKRIDWSCRPMLESLEDRLTPSTTSFSGAGYDGSWDTSTNALVVNTAQADGPLANQTLSIGTIQDNGNTFVTINGTEIAAVMTNEVHSLTLTNTDQVGVKFDISSVNSTDFSNSGFAATVTGLASDGDTLATNNAATTWSINAVDAGSAAGDYTTTFTSISNIVGGSGGNTFDFAALSDVDGSINGGSGSNSFDFSNAGSGGYTTSVSAVVSGTNAGSITAHDTFTFANIQSLTGGSGANTYSFDDTSATPSMVSINGGSGSSNTLDFGAVNNGSITADITGTSSAGSVTGGATLTSFSHMHTLDGSAIGGDTYTIESAAYTGAIAINGGAAGGNTLSYPSSAIGNGAVSLNLQTQTATGVSAFSNIDAAAITANDSTYTLTGANSANAWDISAANAGNLNSGHFGFSGFNILNAGTGGDSFTVDSAVTFSGSIHGNTGSDTLNLLTAGQTVSGLSDSSSGFSGAVTNVSGGFTNIDVLTGTGTTNVLNGEDANATWNLDGSASHYNANSHTLVFDASFQTLNGGSAGDTFDLVSSYAGTLNGGSGANLFAFDNSSVLTGSIVGNTGTDTLDYSSYTPSITVTLTSDAAAGYTGSATGISGTFSKIDSIVGTGSSSDSLTGENAIATWTLGASPYTYTHGSDALSFSDIAHLNGGSGADTFNVSDDFQGNLNGGLGNDAFIFTAAGSVTGNINGGSTTPGDTLDYSGYGSSVSFVVTSASSTIGATGTVTGIGGSFSGITNLVGTTSYTDSLAVAYSPTAYTSATWAVSGGVSGTNTFTDNNSKTFNFSRIENLTGTGGDTFNVTANHTGDLASAARANFFNVTSNSTTTVALTGSIFGGTGVDTVTINGFNSTHPASVTGNITTGGGGDTVHLTGRASVGGAIDAGSSADGTLSYNGFTTSAVSVNVATGAATAIDGGLPSGIANFSNIMGANASGDKLTGPNTANTWDITANNAGTITNAGVVTFSQFKNLVGGTSSDYFNFDNGITVTSINGGAGANTADFSNYTAGITTAVTGANAGTINTNAVAFSAIGSLVGSGNAANTWQFKANGSLSGNISSASSGDTLTYNSSGGYTKPVTVNLQTGAATLIGGMFTNIVSITGSGTSTANTLIGTTTDTFTVTGSNAGSDNTVSFTKFQNLTGTGSGNTFAFNTGGSISGKVNGGTGSNTLDLSGESGAEAVNLATGKATFTGGFSNITAFVGNDNAATSLTGANVNSTWALASIDAGAINSSTNFSGFAKLIGGSLADTFDFADAASITTSINGGAGSNTMDFSNAGSGGYSTGLTVNITANNAGSIEVVPAFSNIQNLTGGAGNNSFVFSAGRGLSGALNGGTGRNTLDYRAYTTAVTVNLGTHAATNVVGGATNILDVFGSATAKNTLTGDGGNDVLVGGTAVDTIKASASGTTTGHAILIGGGGKDILTADKGWDILIGGSTSLLPSDLDSIVSVLAGANSAASLASAKNTIETTMYNGTMGLSASVLSAPGSTITNGAAAGNDWDILNVITTLKNLKTGDIRTFRPSS